MVAGGRYDSSLTRVQPFFSALIDADPSGESWLSALLSATPHASFLGPLLRATGALLGPLTSASRAGRLGCLEYPAHPPRSLLTWFVEHPEELVWPRGSTYSDEATRLRKALVYDAPPGSRAEAQASARHLVATRSTSSREWWRFEGTSMLDCVIMTEKLVVTVEGKPLSAATDWYPGRSQLVRNLEAAKQLSRDRQWASLHISEAPIPDGSDAELYAALPASAPHLTPAERGELHAHYLGNITWEHACRATGLDPTSLPESTDAL